MRPKYPLIVAITYPLPKQEGNALVESGLDVRVVESLKPMTKVSVAARRFEDTWTKLVIFGFEEFQANTTTSVTHPRVPGNFPGGQVNGDIQKIVLLDGDMMVMQNMDELFDADIPRDLITANHACVCNLAKAPWAPVDW